MTDNNILIDPLFRLEKELTVDHPTKGQVKLIVRTVGDYAHRQRFQAAKAASVRARRQLKDENSDLYLAMLADVDDMSRDDMVAEAIIYQRRDLEAEARRQVMDPDFSDERPEDIEELSEIAEDEELARQQVQEERQKMVSEGIKAFADEIATWSDDQLRQWLKERKRREAIETEFMATWMDVTLLHAVMIVNGDERRPLFDSLDQVRSTDTAFKTRLADAYFELDRASRDPSYFKKQR